MSFTKVEYKDQETIITAKNMNDIQDAVLALEDGLFTVENDRSGEVIAITDASQRGFRSFKIHGKTTQAGIPTPDAPIDLVSAGNSGNIMLAVAMKNLLPYPFYQSNLVLNGIAYTDNKDGTVSISGTTTDPSSFWFTGYNFALKKGVTYTLSIGNELTATGSPYLWVNSSKKGIVAGIDMTNQKSVTFTPIDDFFDAGIYISASKAGITISGRIKPQIEVGAVATPFEMYKTQKMAIATPNGLPGIPVASGGNYTDTNGQQWVCDEIDFTRGKFIQRIGQDTIYIRSVATLQNGLQGGVCIFDGKKAVQGGDFLCSNAQATSYGSGIGNGQAYQNAANVVFVGTEEDTLETLRDKYNGGTVLYILATPTETDLTEEALAAYVALYTYKEHTTVSNNDLAYMELEYVMDAKKYIDGLFAGTIIPATVE